MTDIERKRELWVRQRKVLVVAIWALDLTVIACLIIAGLVFGQLIMRLAG